MSNTDTSISSEKLKDEFLQLITHEFQTPLVPIIGFSQALQNPEIYGNLTEKQLDAVKRIFRNSNHLQNMITNVLDVMKLGTDKMMFYNKEFNINDLVTEVLDECDYKANEKKIQVTKKIDRDLIINSDRLRLKQVLTNLIDNAISFVPKDNGKIEIGFSEREEHILFYVKDNGQGIKKNEWSDLFKMFKQVLQGKKRTHGGLGLGLAICRMIVENLGVDIWIESELGKGSTFYCTVSKGNGK
ncbi:MAG: HAMP domain-containing sensor histidine kinase [Nitrosopumilus sp.]